MIAEIASSWDAAQRRRLYRDRQTTGRSMEDRAMTQHSDAAAYTEAEMASLEAKLGALAETLTPGEQAAFQARIADVLAQAGDNDVQGFGVGLMTNAIWGMEVLLGKDLNGDRTVGNPRPPER
jgi:hypothetical protein